MLYPPSPTVTPVTHRHPPSPTHCHPPTVTHRRSTGAEWKMGVKVGEVYLNLDLKPSGTLQPAPRGSLIVASAGVATMISAPVGNSGRADLELHHLLSKNSYHMNSLRNLGTLVAPPGARPETLDPFRWGRGVYNSHYGRVYVGGVAVCDRQSQGGQVRLRPVQALQGPRQGLGWRRQRGGGRCA